MGNDVEDADDPVVATYKIYTTTDINWNNPPPTNVSRKDLYLLQYPTQSRDRPYNKERTPLSMRVKPENGFIEVDVPLQTGIKLPPGVQMGGRSRQWAQALKTTGIGGESGTFGMASGFLNTSMPQGVRRESQHRVAPQDLQTQTLGGMLSKPRRGKPRYVLGTFRGKELHLTPVTGIAQLRPQLHHIDAVDLLERQATRSAAGTSGSDAPVARPAAASRMLTMSQNQGGAASTGGDSGAGKTRELLSRAAEEDWSELKYHHEESSESHGAFNAHAFLPGRDRTKVVTSQWSKEQFLDRVGIKPSSGPAGRQRKSAKRGTSSKPRTSGQSQATAVAVSSGSSAGESDAEE